MFLKFSHNIGETGACWNTKIYFCHKIYMVDQSCPLVCVLIAIILGYVMVLSNVIWQRKLWHHMTKFGQTFTVSTNPDPGVCWNIGRGMLKQNKQSVLKSSSDFLFYFYLASINFPWFIIQFWVIFAEHIDVFSL